MPSALCYDDIKLQGLSMKLSIECERETDGRWIAEITQIPGAMAYGATRDEAMAKAEVVALRAIADRIEHGEAKPLDVSISLAAA
jgi:predicted RNase H-like HicB family nuclease